MMTKSRLIADSANTNSISGERLENGTVTSEKIEGGAITSEKIEGGAVTLEKIESGVLTSSNVSFSQSGAEAIQRTVSDKLEEFVSPEDFGAVGDGFEDDALAFNQALQYCSDTGVPFKARSGATYRIATAYTVDRTTSTAKPLLVDLNNSTVIADDVTALSFNGIQSTYLTTTFSVFPVRGDVKLVLTSTEGIQKGDILRIESPAVFSGAVGAVHVYMVSEVDGQDVYIEGSVLADINPDQITVPNSLPSWWPTTLEVQAVRVAPKLTVQNGRMKVIDPNGSSRFCMLATGGYQIDVFNVDFEGRTRAQLEVRGPAGYFNVTNCSFKDFGYLYKDQGYVNLPESPSGLGFGYGVLITRTCFATLRQCVGYRGWHTVDFARGAMTGIVSDCLFLRNAFGVSSHESSWDVRVMNCVFDGSPGNGGGLTVGRSAYTYVEGCFFKNFANGHGIAYGGNMMEVVVKNCYFDYKQNTSTTYSAIYRASGGSPNLGVISQGYERIFEVSGCTVHGPCRFAAGFGMDTPLGTLTVRNNTFIQATAEFAAMSFTSVKNCHSRRPSQMAFVVSSAAGASILLEQLSHDGGADTTANSALIQLSGSQPSKIIVKDCNGSLGYLMRFFSSLTVYSVVNCSTTERLFLANSPQTATIKNLINNNFGVTGSAGSVVIESSINNNLLVS